MSEEQSRILIIYTGGTIGMVQDHETGVLSPIDFSQIMQEVPEIRKFGHHLEVVSFDPVIDSSNMNPQHWITLAEMIHDHYDDFHGFVILHGTDTLAYTASALSFMLENLAKPVIITGSQLPVGEIRTDARENLVTAIEIAAAKPAIPEVCVYFDYYLFRGNRSTKLQASKFEAFQSMNYPALAEAGVHIRYNRHLMLQAPSGKLKVHTRIGDHVGVIRIFPGISEPWLRAATSVDSLKVIILETYGSGNAPSEEWFLRLLESRIESGLSVINVSQCPGGTVEQGRYETSKKLQSMGVISGLDMTLESALTKALFLIGNNIQVSEFKYFMTQSLRGELTP